MSVETRPRDWSRFAKKEVKKASGKPDTSGPCNSSFTLFVLFHPRGLIRTIPDCGHQTRRDPRLIHGDVHHKGAMIGEGVLWKRVGAEGTTRWGELDSFAQMVSEVSRTSIAACRGGSFHLGRRVKVVEGLREARFFKRKLSRARCVSDH